MIRLLLILLSAVIFLGACEAPDNGGEDYQTTPYKVDLPNAFPAIPIHPENALSVEGVNLGKSLYYDPIIHKDQKEACASCHQQQFSFSSDDVVLPHVNLAFDQIFLWEGGVSGSLEDAMLFEVWLLL